VRGEKKGRSDIGTKGNLAAGGAGAVGYRTTFTGEETPAERATAAGAFAIAPCGGSPGIHDVSDHGLAPVAN
jgi:hypothetical protein